MEWVRNNILARSSRPGYSGERHKPVPSSDVDKWIAMVNAAGVRSIICLLHDDQLPMYASLGMPLPAYYAKVGFQVAHVPVKDHQTPPISPADLARAMAAFQSLPKPVLVHCSAGVDRTGAVVRHIQDRL